MCPESSWVEVGRTGEAGGEAVVVVAVGDVVDGVDVVLVGVGCVKTEINLGSYILKFLEEVGEEAEEGEGAPKGP